MYNFSFPSILTLVCLLGCEGPITTQTAENCRNDGVECNDGFACVQDETGEYECRAEADGGLEDTGPDTTVDAAPEPTCEDGVVNGDETDVDCGGGECLPCNDGQACIEGSDCLSFSCSDGDLCTPPACDDAVLNGTETDVDCGGTDCLPCPTDSVCVDDGDCIDGRCVDDQCAAPSCDDVIKNGRETDTDCGGSDCPACDAGRACLEASDCQSTVCTDNTCQAATCGDGVWNGSESDIDCGGDTCAPCAETFACAAQSDCASGVCGADSLCAVPRCGDGVMNRAEEQCDDGNDDDSDACPSTCLEATCGDGFVQSDVEACDAGGVITEDCDYGEAACTVCTAACAEAPGEIHVCGDGILDDVETCDDANDDDTDDCTNACQAAACGDGIVQAGVETCDDGNDNEADACRGTCEAAACGDGVVQLGVEACDDGNHETEECAYGLDACTVCAADCTEVAGLTHLCGDNVIDAVEICDDGNIITEECAYGLEACTVCAADCTEQPGETHVCGDGTVDEPEECDDANDDPFDGCLVDCRSASPAHCAGICDDAGTIAGHIQLGSLQRTPNIRAPGNRHRQGTSMAMAGDTAMVYINADSWDDPDAIEVYERRDDGWARTWLLRPEGRSISDKYGLGLAMTENTVFVGAPNHSIEFGVRGIVYVFEAAGAGWSQTTTLIPSEHHRGFGSAIAADGERVIIGAPRHPDRDDWQHGAYIFEKIDGTWTEVAQLVGDDVGPDDGFGKNVAIHGDTALVSAELKSIGEENGAGAVYVFERDEEGWRQTAQIVAPEPVANGRFGSAGGNSEFDPGTAIALHGDNAAIAAVFGAQGAVYTFQRSGGQWQLTTRLTGPDEAANDGFGRSIDLDAERLVIGAPGDDTVGPAIGAAWIYEQRDGQWQVIDAIYPPEEEAWDACAVCNRQPNGLGFGHRVALSGDEVLIANPGEAQLNRQNQIKRESGAFYSIGISGGSLCTSDGACVCSEAAAGPLCEQRP